jgi:hypothetical protein
MALLKNGFRTTVTFPLGGVTIEEIEVKPGGWDLGPPIQTATMRSNFRTQYPQALPGMTNTTVKAAYDPVALAQLHAMLGIIQAVAVTFPLLSGLSVSSQAWVNKSEPDTLKNGAYPMMDIEVCHALQTNAGVEAAPVNM